MNLPDHEIRQCAGIMLEELNALKLTVVAIPDGRPNSYRKVRVVICPNPDWYSRLCGQYVSHRTNKRYSRPRTIIKRCDVVKALARLQQNGPSGRFAYEDRLLDAMEWLLKTRGPVN